MIEVNTYEDLIKAIQHPKISLTNACSIVSTFLGVLVLYEPETKAELIKQVEDYINKWRDEDTRPIFLQQLTNCFEINTFYSGESS